jgi:hypothetical protein
LVQHLPPSMRAHFPHLKPTTTASAALRALAVRLVREATR